MNVRVLLSPCAVLICASSLFAQAFSEPPQPTIGQPWTGPAAPAANPTIRPGASANGTGTSEVMPARILFAKPLPPEFVPPPAQIAPPTVVRGAQIGELGALTAAQPSSQLSPQMQSWQPLPDEAHLPNYSFDNAAMPLSFADGPFSTRDKCYWVSADYVLAWMHGMTLPPLVTTSPSGTPASTAGIIGAPGTKTIFGGTDVDGSVRSGFRLGAGWWFSDDKTLGIEAGFMGFSSQTTSYYANSGGSMILARPYTDATTSLNQAVLAAYPGSSAGSIGIQANSAGFFTGNIDFVDKNYENSWYRLSTLIGYRYYAYNENLYLNQNIMPLSTAFVPGTSIASTDHFATRNIFNGADLGMRNEFYWDNFSLEILTKVAIGRMNSLASVNGSSITSVPGASPVISQNGVYALGSNSGAFSQNHMSVLPELGATLKWQVCNCMQVHLGYSLLLLNGIARASSQVNQVINPSNFVPGTTGASPNQPAFMLRTSDAWIQTLNFGVVITF